MAAYDTIAEPPPQPFKIASDTRDLLAHVRSMLRYMPVGEVQEIIASEFVGRPAAPYQDRDTASEAARRY